MSVFIADAVAASAPAAGSATADPLLSFLPLLIIVVFFYFMLIRPQNKRAKEHRELLASLTKGDEVATTGGLLGKVVRVSDDFVVIEVADGCEVKLQKASVATVLPKGTLKNI